MTLVLSRVPSMTMNHTGARAITLLLLVSGLVACSSDPAGTTSSGTTTSSGATSGSGAGGEGAGGMGTGGEGTGGMIVNEAVSLLASPCTKSPPSATRCEAYEVTCGGADPAIVELATYEPDAGVAKIGTIVFGSGGDGTGFYNYTLRKQLLAQGYTVIDRRWPNGWFTGATEGPQQAACRLSAVLRHLRKGLPGGARLCATGNSGGSAELTYALTWQGAGKALDFAMPTSGPFHRLDLACQGAADAGWTAQCAAIKAGTCPECASTGCQLGNGPRSLVDTSFGGTPRCSAPGAGDMALLQGLSPVAGPMASTLDGTPVHFLVGKDDPGAYEPLATALHDELVAHGADATIDYVTGAPHEMDTTMEGAVAIRNTLLAECVPKP